MASADIYGACVSYLDGDTGAVRVAVNAEQTSLMAASSCFVSRRPTGKGIARGSNALGRTIAISQLDEIEDEVPAPGWRMRGAAFLFQIAVRAKALPKAKTQLDVLREIQRALVAAFDGMSNLVIPVTGTLAVFRYAAAKVDSIDEDPEVAEVVTGAVRAVFYFTEPQGANA